VTGKPAPAALEVFYPMIDALRGPAALAVLLSHVVSWSWFHSFPIDGSLVVFRFGYVSVFLFFTISGFVITNSALALYERNPEAFARQFLRRRLLRLYPVYVVTIVAYLVVVPPAFGSRIILDLLAHLTFIHNWILKFAISINAPNWSMAPEMHFYVLMAFALPFIVRLRPLVIIVGSCLVAWSWRLTTYVVMPHSTNGEMAKLHFVSSQIPGTLDVLALGIALALVMRSATYQRLKQNRLFVKGVRIGALLGTYLVFQIFWLWPLIWENIWMVVFFRTAIAVAGALAIFAATTIAEGPVVKWTAPLRYLGTISLGIYLWHFPVMFFLSRKLDLGPEGLGSPAFITYVLIGTFAISALSWHYFEKPILKKFRASRDHSHAAAQALALHKTG
jgi:peptidoglycan/LPS O-acetylase OafA/YrhL